jgi:hypothetical protein
MPFAADRRRPLEKEVFHTTPLLAIPSVSETCKKYRAYKRKRYG